jgi:hypothetical protein
MSMLYVREQLVLASSRPRFPTSFLGLLFIAAFLKTPMEPARQNKRPSLHA